LKDDAGVRAGIDFLCHGFGQALKGEGLPLLHPLLRLLVIPGLMGVLAVAAAAEPATKHHARSAEELMFFGQTLLDRGHPDAAIPLFEEVTAMQPDYAKAYELLGDAHALLGQSDKAINMYEKFLVLAPGDSDATAIHRYIADNRTSAKTKGR
jgi:tetratricopeptide (TPR) repeat protein